MKEDGDPRRRPLRRLIQQYGQKSIMAGLGCGGAGGEQWLDSGTILKVQLTECGGGEGNDASRKSSLISSWAPGGMDPPLTEKGKVTEEHILRRGPGLPRDVLSLRCFCNLSGELWTALGRMYRGKGEAVILLTVVQAFPKRTMFQIFYLK